jgi:hypothetical protein
MAATYSGDTDVATTNGTARTMGILTLIAGIVLIIAGGFTWFVVTDQLKAENITVSEDASCAAGDAVDGPISAYCQAQVIAKHALEATGGKTYAELGREDPTRNTAMTASFLRASLFTSVVSYGVAAMAAGLGLVFILIVVALNSLSKR